MSLKAKPRPSKGVPSVSQLTAQIRDCLSGAFPQVEVQGEISNLVRQQRSGHTYFTLKDREATLSCVLFKGAAWRIQHRLEEGQAVILTGALEVYPPRGNYQVIVSGVRPAGAGDLRAQLEALRQRFQGAGYFDPVRKQALPPMPLRVAIVTSPSGAAIRDMLSVLERQGARGDFLLLPTRVQGEGAVEELVSAIEAIDRVDAFDAVILARGGGSLEDLWSFNSEALVKAILGCRVPVITGVGHETDVSLADLAADLRAETPTAAAMAIVQQQRSTLERLESLAGAHHEVLEASLEEFRRSVDGYRQRRERHPFSRLLQLRQQGLDDQAQRLDRAASSLVRQHAQSAALLSQRLRSWSPDLELRRLRQKLAERAQRLHRAGQQSMKTASERRRWLQGRLTAASPEATLNRGYAIIESPQGAVIESVVALDLEDRVRVRLKDGERLLENASDATPEKG